MLADFKSGFLADYSSSYLPQRIEVFRNHYLITVGFVSMTVMRYCYSRTQLVFSGDIFKFFNHFKHILVLCSLHWCHNESDGVSNHRRLIVYLIVCSGADQRKHQSSASMVFVGRSHWWSVNSQHKGPVTPKKFPFDDVTMVCHHFPKLTMPVLALCTGHYLMKQCIQAIGFLSESINPWPRCQLAHINYLSLTFNRTVYAYLGGSFFTSYVVGLPILYLF